MSRVSTQQPGQMGSTHQGHIPHERIASRAYDKWCKRGRPHGQDRQDWLEAESELRAEAARGASAGSTTQAQQPHRR
jgi:hypothetical protein